MSDEIQSDETSNVQISSEEVDEQAAEQAETEDATENEPKDDDDDDDEAAANNQNPKPILYNLNISPVVRCVKIVARLINLELELRYEF